MRTVRTYPNFRFRLFCWWVMMIPLVLQKRHIPVIVMGFFVPPSRHGRHVDSVDVGNLSLRSINNNGRKRNGRTLFLFGEDFNNVYLGKDVTAVRRRKEIPKFPRKRTRKIHLSLFRQGQEASTQMEEGQFRQPTILIQYMIFKWRQIRQFIRQLIHRTTVYVLECEHGKYYVGSTRHRRQRYRQHFQRDMVCSKWTRLHPPRLVLMEYRRIPERYLMGFESQVTAEMMIKYGVNNVRGSYFTSTQDYTMKDLSALTRFLGHYNRLKYQELSNELKRTLPPAIDRQEKSLLSGYGAASSLLNGPSGDYETVLKRQRKQWPPRRRRIDKSNDICYRCGERGHWAYECPTRQMGDIEL